MKKSGLILMVLIAKLFISVTQVDAQEVAKPKFQAGADVYSNYIWRGSKLGNGPSFQPSVKFIAGGLTIGVWGAFDAEGFTETDPYVSYSFPFGLSIGLTDYYYPGQEGSFFADSSNAYELNAGFTTGGLSLSANYIINEASVPASAGRDLYFQAGYAFKNCSIFIGAGDGWHTSDGDFAICHLGLGTIREIKITDTFTIPVNGQIILNPDREQLYVVIGFTF